VEGRCPALDHPAHHRLKQHLLAAEAMIEGALRHAGTLGDRFDTGRAEAVAEKQRRRDIENTVGEPRRLQPGRTAAMAPQTNPPAFFRLERHYRLASRVLAGHAAPLPNA